MTVKDDAIEIAVAVCIIAAGIWWIESKYQAAGGVTGMSAQLFTYVTGPLFSGGDPTPGLGAIPDGTTLNTTNSTQSPLVNELENSTLTMQSIGM